MGCVWICISLFFCFILFLFIYLFIYFVLFFFTKITVKPHNFAGDLILLILQVIKICEIQ